MTPIQELVLVCKSWQHAQDAADRLHRAGLIASAELMSSKPSLDQGSKEGAVSLVVSASSQNRENIELLFQSLRPVQGLD